jgi:putative peptidoglycan lipid II flippase
MFEGIRSQLTNPRSFNRQIAVGFIWVSLFVLLGKIAGAAKEMTIAWRYGVSPTVDAYVFVFGLINWPVSIWFSILSVVLVPLAAGLRGNTPDELPRFRTELLGLAILIGLAIGVLAWLLLPPLLNANWLGLSEAVLNEALQIAGPLALLAPLGVFIGLFSAWLLAAGHHRNTLFEAIPALTLLVFLMLPPGWIHEPLVWGTVAGFALHMLALATPLKQRRELPSPTFAQRSPAWQVFWASIGIMALGQVMSSATNLVDQFIAAGLSPGTLSTLSYANRVLALLLGLGATAISRATLPIFSNMHAKDRKTVKTLAQRWSLIMFVVGVGTMALMWVIAPWAVQILFERGAFTPNDTHAVMQILRLSLWQLPFFFPALVFVAALAAQGSYAKIAISGAFNLIFKLPIALILVHMFGIEGLVISTVLMYAFSAILLYWFMRTHQTD